MEEPGRPIGGADGQAEAGREQEREPHAPPTQHRRRAARLCRISRRGHGTRIVQPGGGRRQLRKSLLGPVGVVRWGVAVETGFGGRLEGRFFGDFRSVGGNAVDPRLLAGSLQLALLIRFGETLLLLLLLEERRSPDSSQATLLLLSHSYARGPAPPRRPAYAVRNDCGGAPSCARFPGWLRRPASRARGSPATDPRAATAR